MNIRDALESDLPAIIEIYNSTIACRSVTADLAPVTVASRTAWFHSHTPAKHPLWIAETNNQTAGLLGFHAFYYGRPAYDATAELSIDVAPSYRRQGVGRLLLQTAIEKSPSLGLKTLLGFIFAHNQPSLRLFEQFGFEQWGYLPGVAEFDQADRDLVIMGLRIRS